MVHPIIVSVVLYSVLSDLKRKKERKGSYKILVDRICVIKMSFILNISGQNEETSMHFPSEMS